MLTKFWGQIATAPACKLSVTSKVKINRGNAFFIRRELGLKIVMVKYLNKLEINKTYYNVSNIYYVYFNGRFH